MQPVRRKRQKGLNNKTKAIIILFLIALAITFILLSKPEQNKTDVSADNVFNLLSVEKEDISRISIKPENGQEYSIEQTSDKKYYIKDEQDFLLDEDMVYSIFDTACFWEAHYKIGENFSDEKLNEFGISNDSLMVKIKLNQDKNYVFVFGDKINAENPFWYIYAQHENTLYATKINYTDIYNFTLKELYPVPEINFSSDLVDKITISGKGKEIIITRHEDLWGFESPVEYPLSKLSGEQLAKKIEKMRLAAYEAPKSEQNIKEYGLDTPEAIITFDIADSFVYSPDGKKANVPKHQIKISIGSSIEGIGFYCLYENNIYKATSLSMGFLLDIKVKDMLLTSPVNISIDRLESLTFIKGDNIAAYSLVFTESVLKNNEIEKDEYGNTVYNLSVFKNGSEYDEQAFITNYTELTKLQIDGRLPDNFNKSAEKASFSITLKYEGGERAIEFYPFDPLHSAVSIDGVFLHYISNDKLNNLKFLDNNILK